MEFYRSQVLVCTGTGCSSSNSRGIIAKFEEEIKNAHLEKEIKVVPTGCFGYVKTDRLSSYIPRALFIAE